MSKFTERVKVVANTFVTYAVLVSSALAGAAGALQASDVPAVAQGGAWAAAAVGVIGAAIKVIRQVSQVPPEFMGLLPIDVEEMFENLMGDEPFDIVDDLDEEWDEWSEDA